MEELGVRMGLHFAASAYVVYARVGGWPRVGRRPRSSKRGMGLVADGGFCLMGQWVLFNSYPYLIILASAYENYHDVLLGG